MSQPGSTRLLLRLAMLTLLVSTASSAWAANPHNRPAIDEIRSISFGVIAASSASGTATLSPSGSLTCMGIRCLGGASPGLFAITGAKDYVVAILLSPARLRTARGATLDVQLKPSQNIMVLRPGNAKNAFSVGGALTVSSNQAEGSYEGSYLVSVEYQ